MHKQAELDAHMGLRYAQTSKRKQIKQATVWLEQTIVGVHLRFHELVK